MFEGSRRKESIGLLRCVFGSTSFRGLVRASAASEKPLDNTSEKLDLVPLSLVSWLRRVLSLEMIRVVSDVQVTEIWVGIGRVVMGSEISQMNFNEPVLRFSVRCTV